MEDLHSVIWVDNRSLLVDCDDEEELLGSSLMDHHAAPQVADEDDTYEVLTRGRRESLSYGADIAAIADFREEEVYLRYRPHRETPLTFRYCQCNTQFGQSGEADLPRPYCALTVQHALDARRLQLFQTDSGPARRGRFSQLPTRVLQTSFPMHIPSSLHFPHQDMNLLVIRFNQSSRFINSYFSRSTIVMRVL